MDRNTKKIIFWLCIATFSCAFIYAISSVLLPFIVGILAAYLLDPVADRLEKWKLNRGVASALLIIILTAIIIGIATLIVPNLIGQFEDLIRKMPLYVSQLYAKYGDAIQSWVDKIDPEITNSMRDKSADISAVAAKYGANFANNIWQSGLALINLLSLIFISPIVCFYLLKDWDKIIKKVDNLIPRESLKTVRQLATDVDRTLSGYIRGQFNVCIILGIFYSICLMLAGLDFGLLIGLGTGLLSFIPFVGLLIGMVTGLIVAFVQFGTFGMIALIFAIFVIGQIIEGNFITPKLVGNKVGLHELWIIFALLAGGALLGFTGVLIAIPFSAILGVFIRFMISEYQTSEYYKKNTK